MYQNKNDGSRYQKDKNRFYFGRVQKT